MHRLLFIVVFIYAFYFQANAQSCSGSLGDPVINITFGSGSNPGPALPAGVTSYTYLTTACPNDGEYTIASLTSGCHGSSWHTVTNHTPNDPNGYMMIVNADYNPGDFYLQKVTGLCGGTTYEFAAWVINLLLPTSCAGNKVQPDLTFSIETTNGTVLATHNTGVITESATPLWQRIAMLFTTPTNVDNVVIRLRNNGKGGCGNDLALDDITFSPCGPKLTVGDAATNHSVINQCEDNMSQVTLHATVTAGYNNPTFQWQKSANNGSSWTDIVGAVTTSLTVNPSGKGTTLYRMAAAEFGNINSANCRIVSNNVAINVYPIPETGIQSNSPVCENDIINLTANSGKSYTWSGPDGFTSALQNPTISAHPNKAGTYTLMYTDNNNCSATGTTNVVVNTYPQIDAGEDVSICDGEFTMLPATGNATSYKWSPETALSDPNIVNPVASPHETITYTVTASNDNCSVSDDIEVKVWKSPKANAGPDKVILDGQSVILNGEISGDDISYIWRPVTSISDEHLLTPTVNPSIDITYTLLVSSAHGCPIATDDVFVKVFKKLTIPNAFSPNNDGVNDFWRLESLQVYPESTVEVYNRFGQKVFSGIGKYSPVWDGSYKGNALPDGGYAYVINLRNGAPIISGVVFIVR